MNRILEVTDEEDTLILEFRDRDDLKYERLLPNNLVTTTDQWSTV